MVEPLYFQSEFYTIYEEVLAVALCDVKPKSKPKTSTQDTIFVTPEKFTVSELNIARLIQRRRLQVLVHSCIYYELNENIVSDSTWSRWATELVELQNKYPEIASRVCYAEAFKDFDASTGAFLPLRGSWVMSKALYLLRIQN